MCSIKCSHRGRSYLINLTFQGRIRNRVMMQSSNSRVLCRQEDRETDEDNNQGCGPICGCVYNILSECSQAAAFCVVRKSEINCFQWEGNWVGNCQHSTWPQWLTVSFIPPLVRLIFLHVIHVHSCFTKLRFSSKTTSSQGKTIFLPCMNPSREHI